MLKTDVDSLRSSFVSEFFRLSFALNLINLLLVRFHQIVNVLYKHSTTRIRLKLKHQLCDHGSRKKDSPNYYVTMPTKGREPVMHSS